VVDNKQEESMTVSLKTMFGSSLPLVVCRRADVLFMLFVLICVVSNTSWIYELHGRRLKRGRNCLPIFASTWVHSLFWSMVLMFLVFCVLFCFVFILCVVYPMLPVSLHCPSLIAPSVFSNIYLIHSMTVHLTHKNT
jgi:hypothetical protein